MKSQGNPKHYLYYSKRRKKRYHLKEVVIMKVSAIVLCLSILLLTVSACGGNTGTEQHITNTDTTVAKESAVPETEAQLTDSLPEIDFEGRTIQILTAAEQWSYFYEAEQTGNTVDDAVYQRNMAVEERFNVDLVHYMMNGYNAGKPEVKKALSNSVMSGSTDFDLVTGGSSYVTNLTTDKLLTDLYTMEYLDLSAPWWLNHVNKEVEIGNKLLLGAGYYGTNCIANAIGLFFNKAYIDIYGLEEPYRKVLDGVWTLDQMTAMAKSVLTDTNGDGVYHYSDDEFGFFGNKAILSLGSCGMGANFSEKNADGSVTILIPDEHMVDLNDRLVSFASSEGYFDWDEGFDMNPYDAFASGHSLFILTYLSTASKFRDMESGYGIVPMTKYDESQEEYVSVVVPDLAGIPYVVADFKTSAVILEALQYESWKTVRPAYYDITLKEKYANDTATGKMLDILMENTTCPFTYMYGALLGDDVIPYNMCKEGFNTWMEQRISGYQKNADSLAEAIKEE